MKNALKDNPLSGEMFVFVNRRKNQMKVRAQWVLHWVEEAGAGAMCRAQCRAQCRARFIGWKAGIELDRAEAATGGY